MPTSPDRPTLPDLHCACANLRRAARLVTQLYSQEMGSVIEPAQFSLLSILRETPGMGQTPLSRIAGMDKTTMSRNLALMHRNGWIEALSSDDRRERGFRLTSVGRKILSDAKPGWTRAQAKLRGTMKSTEWETLLRAVNHAAQAAQNAADG